MIRDMKGYLRSIKQPWAWLIAAGYKDTENRSWPTKFRGRFYIHAGQRYDKKAVLPSGIGPVIYVLSIADAAGDFGDNWPLGVIIGEATLTDCIYRFPDENDDLYSPWHERGMYGFKIKDPVLYREPIPYKGRLNFFKIEGKLIPKK